MGSLFAQEDLSDDSTRRILDALRNGQTPKAGPQNGRFTCEPKGVRSRCTRQPWLPGWLADARVLRAWVCYDRRNKRRC